MIYVISFFSCNNNYKLYSFFINVVVEILVTRKYLTYTTTKKLIIVIQFKKISWKIMIANKLNLKTKRFISPRLISFLGFDFFFPSSLLSWAFSPSSDPSSKDTN